MMTSCHQAVFLLFNHKIPHIPVLMPFDVRLFVMFENISEHSAGLFFVFHTIFSMQRPLILLYFCSFAFLK